MYISLCFATLLLTERLFSILDKAVSFKGAESYAVLDGFRNNKMFSASMDVRLSTKDGMLLYGQDVTSPEFVSIGIKNGFVEVRYARVR